MDGAGRNQISVEEIKRLVEAIPNLKHRVIIMAIYSAGLRLGELIRLRVEDIKLSQQKIYVHGSKNKKDRYTLLSSQFVSTLQKYLEAYRPEYWLFEGQTGGQYSASSIQKIFRRACQRAGVGDFATVHTLRHSFATHLLLEQGVGIRYIQVLLGHAHVDTTMIYTHVAQDQLKKIASPIDDIQLESMYS